MFKIIPIPRTLTSDQLIINIAGPGRLKNKTSKLHYHQQVLNIRYAEEMIESLGTSTHIGWLTAAYNSSFRGSSNLSGLLGWVSAHLWQTLIQTYMANSHIHTHLCRM